VGGPAYLVFLKEGKREKRGGKGKGKGKPDVSGVDAPQKGKQPKMPFLVKGGKEKRERRGYTLACLLALGGDQKKKPFLKREGGKEGKARGFLVRKRFCRGEDEPPSKRRGVRPHRRGGKGEKGKGKKPPAFSRTWPCASGREGEGEKKIHNTSLQAGGRGLSREKKEEREKNTSWRYVIRFLWIWEVVTAGRPARPPGNAAATAPVGGGGGKGKKKEGGGRRLPSLRLVGSIRKEKRQNIRRRNPRAPRGGGKKKEGKREGSPPRTLP